MGKLTALSPFGVPQSRKVESILLDGIKMQPFIETTEIQRLISRMDTILWLIQEIVIWYPKMIELSKSMELVKRPIGLQKTNWI